MSSSRRAPVGGSPLAMALSLQKTSSMMHWCETLKGSPTLAEMYARYLLVISSSMTLWSFP